MWNRLDKKYKIGICCLLALVLIFAGEAEADKEIPPLTKFSYNSAAPTVTFLYCYSCGYRKAFEEYSNILHDKYPEIQIKGGNFDPPGFNMYFSRVIMMTKLLFIIAIMSSFDFWATFGVAVPPTWWTWCTSNKVYSSMMVFFLGNMIESQLISSGAFEISFNDVPIWSKLQTGRIPAPQELFQILDSQMMLQEGANIGKNPDFVK